MLIHFFLIYKDFTDFNKNFYLREIIIYYICMHKKYLCMFVQVNLLELYLCLFLPNDIMLLLLGKDLPRGDPAENMPNVY